MVDNKNIRNFFQINDETKDDILMTLGAVTEKEQEYDIKKELNEIKLPVISFCIILSIFS
jgi:hypothetical protein